MGARGESEKDEARKAKVTGSNLVACIDFQPRAKNQRTSQSREKHTEQPAKGLPSTYDSNF